MMELKNPAGCPGSYQPSACPTTAAKTLPAIPKIAVGTQPEGPVPLMINLAIKPMTNPMQTDQMMLIPLKSNEAGTAGAVPDPGMAAATENGSYGEG